MLAEITAFFIPLALLVERVVAAFAGYMVYLDASGRTERTFNLAPIWWGLAVFFAGAVFGIVGYWLIHYSGLRAAHQRPDEAAGEAPA